MGDAGEISSADPDECGKVYNRLSAGPAVDALAKCTLGIKGTTMSRTACLTALAVLVGAAVLAPADTVTLTDGRVLTGQVSEEPGLVVIETAYGTVSIPSQQVLSIEHRPTAQSELADRISQVRPNDPAGLYALGVWASEQGLAAEAEQLWRQVIQIDHDHADARRALGYVRLGRRWLDFELALQLIESRIATGQIGEDNLDAALAELRPMARTTSEVLRIGELEALLLLRQGRFVHARDAFLALTEAGGDDPPAQLHRWRAIAAILEEHPDGMIVLNEPFPPETALLGEAHQAVLPAGPASLTEPLALQAGLRDAAKAHTDAGRILLRDGRGEELTDPDAARRLYLRAEAEFDIANAIVPGIARSYRIEIARRRIAIVRRHCDEQAGRFDAEMATLGRQAMPPRLYLNKIQRMVRNLQAIQADLEEILRLARPFEQELILEARWAELDRQRIDSMMATLRQELDDQSVGRAP